jgi:uncharacterized membrane protein YccC
VRTRKDVHGPAEERDSGMSLATHPVASEQIRLAKGLGGLFGLLVVAWATWKAGAPLLTIGVRALLAGLVGYALAWAFTLSLWRHIALADIQKKRNEAEEAYRAYLAEQESAAALGDRHAVAAPAA